MILITGRTYDVLKAIAQVVLPALGTLYFTLAGIWNLPSAQEVVNTIIAVDTFLGVVLHLSSRAYTRSGKRFDGEMNVQKAGDKQIFQLSFDDEESVKKLADKDAIVFRVNREE
jgi:hypothetical protein